jgi:hypothetical protein
LNKVPSFHEILQNSKNDETFSAQIMKYDLSVEPVAIVGLERQRYAHHDIEKQYPSHQFHQGATSAVIGRGRFSKTHKVAELLWQASNMALDMRDRMYEPQSLQNRTLISYQPADLHVPQFWICTRSDEFLKSSVPLIIGFVKHNTVFQNLLGLTRPDGAHWTNDWLQMSNSEGPLIESVANHLFGDTLLSYPEMSVLNILIKFHTTVPAKKPLLLRISIGQDPRSEILDCHHCDKTFQLIDYIGPQGAVKIHWSSRDAPGPRARHPHQFRDWTDFSTDHTTKRHNFCTKWSQIAYLYQGCSHMPLLVRCTCENKMHKNIKSQHFIDLWNEKACEEDNDVFDSTGESCQNIMDSFEPYPHESHFVVIIDPQGAVEDSDSDSEDRWDPDGDAGSEVGEEFEPFPPEEHGEKFLSPAVRLH